MESPIDKPIVRLEKDNMVLGSERRQLVAAFESATLLAIQAVPDKHYRNGNPAGIYIGLRMAFPELAGNPQTETGKDRLNEVYSMVDYINTFNSIVDDAAGMRRILEARSDTPHREKLEAAIEGIEYHWQEKKINMFSLFEKHGRKEEAETIARTFEEDLRRLVVEGNQDITTYTERMCIQRREYDNAIFELACAATLYGVDKFQEEYGTSGQSIEARYGWMIDKSKPANPIKHWVKSLHKTYIAAGIFDDFQGIPDDLKLGLITYPAYLLKVKGLSIIRIREEVDKLATEYNKEAESLGMSKVIRRAI